jgi:hypothetical protein
MTGWDQNFGKVGWMETLKDLRMLWPSNLLMDCRMDEQKGHCFDWVARMDWMKLCETVLGHLTGPVLAVRIEWVQPKAVRIRWVDWKDV